MCRPLISWRTTELWFDEQQASNFYLLQRGEKPIQRQSRQGFQCFTSQWKQTCHRMKWQNKKNAWDLKTWNSALKISGKSLEFYRNYNPCWEVVTVELFDASLDTIQKEHRRFFGAFGLTEAHRLLITTQLGQKFSCMNTYRSEVKINIFATPHHNIHFLYFVPTFNIELLFKMGKR